MITHRSLELILISVRVNEECVMVIWIKDILFHESHPLNILSFIVKYHKYFVESEILPFIHGKKK